MMEHDETTCPHCAEVIKAAAIKCKHCQSNLTNAQPTQVRAAQAQPTSSPQKKTPVWVWVLLSPVALLLLMLLIGFLSGPPSEQSKKRAAISLCWDRYDSLKSEGEKEFMKGACNILLNKYESDYGSAPSLRRD